jgi:hypothetical protein
VAEQQLVEQRLLELIVERWPQRMLVLQLLVRWGLGKNPSLRRCAIHRFADQRRHHSEPALLRRAMLI